METFFMIFIGSYLIGMFFNLMTVVLGDASENMDVFLLLIFPGVHMFGVVYLLWIVCTGQFKWKHDDYLDRCCEEWFDRIAKSFTEPFCRKKHKREQIDKEYAFLVKKAVEAD